MNRDKLVIRELINFFPTDLAKLINEYDIDFPSKNHKKKMYNICTEICHDLQYKRNWLNEMQIPKKIHRVLRYPGVYSIKVVDDYKWTIHRIKDSRFQLSETSFRIIAYDIVEKDMQIEFVKEYVDNGILTYSELNSEWQKRYMDLRVMQWIFQRSQPIL